MSMRDNAKALANQGFHVFPISDNQKIPAIKNWSNRSACTPEGVDQLWAEAHVECPWLVNPNIGIATSKYGQGALLVVDVDTKPGKVGARTVIELEMQGFVLPDTLEQRTSTGGRHLIYYVNQPVHQGTDILGKDIDIRSRGGLIVGQSSTIDGIPYTMNQTPIQWAPDWVVQTCLNRETHERKALNQTAVVDQDTAMTRGISFLKGNAPLAIEGAAGERIA